MNDTVFCTPSDILRQSTQRHINRKTLQKCLITYCYTTLAERLRTLFTKNLQITSKQGYRYHKIRNTFEK